MDGLSGHELAVGQTLLIDSMLESRKHQDIRYNYIIHQGKKAVFSVSFDIDEAISEKMLLKIFILMSKHFPGYIFYRDDFIDKEMKWEEYLLKHFTYRPQEFNNIAFDFNVYLQDCKDVFLMKTVQSGIEIVYGTDEGKPVLIFDFYPYVYFTKNTLIPEEIYDQSIASQKNRLILRGFLMDLEELLGTNISFFEGGYRISKESLYKYGIREDAVLDDLPG